ncbi:MAG: erythromycin esterase family protein [Actinophytocola sp.]|uniref:erythromycin esterase family protein n=1 Tax=Actinophytocola sp. TaxID=1872138 RepID=UPI003D6C3919
MDIRDFLTPSCALLGLGEPTHREPVFSRLRNELFAQLVDHGFRSIALETDRVAALVVNDFVQQGTGNLDAAMNEGFTHDLSALEPNRQLVSWMREYNETRPPSERLAFHGCDAPTENTNAPSPRGYLEHVRDYLQLDGDIEIDIASITGDDERWSRTEAILDPAQSPGATPEAERLRVIADDLVAALYARAPELIAATSRARWLRARTHLTAGIGLLRYHNQAAEPLDRSARISRLLASRDVLMAQNLFEIREIEARRGPTLVFAHNVHLRHKSTGPQDWYGAGAIVGSLADDYVFVAGSLGRSEIHQIPEPEPDSYEGVLQGRFPNWGLTRAVEVTATRTRTNPFHGYFPLDQELLDAAEGVLHANG